MVDVELARVDDRAAGVGIVPAPGNDTAAIGGHPQRLQAIQDQHLGTGVPAVAVGIHPVPIVNAVERPPDRIEQHGLPQFADRERSEEHTSKLQSLMRSSYAVFCLKKKTQN